MPCDDANCSERGLLRRGWPILLAFLASACAQVPPPSSGNTTVPPPMEILRLDSPAGAFAPLTLDVTPIGPASADALLAPVAPAVAPTAFTHLFGGLDQASRGVASVTTGPWRKRWSSRLAPEFGTFGLLAAGDRVLVVGRLHELISDTGSKLYSGLTGSALPGLFPAAKAWLTIDGAGNLQRRSLDGAELEFTSPAFGGDEYTYNFVALRGDAYLVAGSERRLDPHGGRKPSLAQLHRLEMKPPFKIDPSDRLLLEAGGGEALQLPSTVLVPVANGDRLVVATQNLLLLSDFALAGRRALAGDFVPLAASMDHGGNLHLIVRAKQSVQYWAVSADGRRRREMALTAALPQRIVPPILGYDGRVFLQLADRIIAVASDGSQQASLRLRDPGARAIAQPDGSLIVADGSTIWHFDRELRATSLVETGGDPLRTAAIALTNDRIYAASDSTLYCFERSGAQ